MTHHDVIQYIKKCQRLVNLALKRRLPPASKEPGRLHKAMRYSVLNGGKRIRAAFAYATGLSMGANQKVVDDVSAAVEMIHAFSLIHDDLPALDNDDLRRGKPTCHKVFGEATAILAGDALQVLPFEIISSIPEKYVPSATKIEMIRLLANAIGSLGMMGGEELDLEAVKKLISVKKLERIFQLKTGCLLKASILLGALSANCKDKKTLSHLTQFGEYIGLAFQIHDDIIGISSSTEILGKKQGADLELEKPVYPVLVGMEKAKIKEQFYYKKSIWHLDKCQFNTDKLKAISAYIIERNY